MSDFVRQDSIVRRIWGDGDTILLVFAGGAAEFALNRAVDWLFFTGELPRDPIGRLFSTAAFAQDIVFADGETAQRTLNRIRAIHQTVEQQRGGRIPDWAHRDVLYMLIDYSERAHTLLHRPLTGAEREELYGVFRRVGIGLGIPDLPASYGGWQLDRARHLERNLAPSALTRELYAQYRQHLGPWRFRLLLQTQSVLVPRYVEELLGMSPASWLRHALPLYRVLAGVGLRPLIRGALLPTRYIPEVRRLDQAVPA
jgi:uncharacterized protein (DUF2236 family)